MDVPKAPEVSAWCDDVIEEFGQVDGIDGVINNAGVSVIDGAEFVSHEDFEWLMGINFWGVIYGTQTFLPHLRKRPDAYIVNISSLFGLIGANAGCLQRIEICGARLHRGPSSGAPWEHYPRCLCSSRRYSHEYYSKCTSSSEEVNLSEGTLGAVFEKHLTKVTPEEAAEIIVEVWLQNENGF